MESGERRRSESYWTSGTIGDLLPFEHLHVVNGVSLSVRAVERVFHRFTVLRDDTMTGSGAAVHFPRVLNIAVVDSLSITEESGNPVIIAGASPFGVYDHDMG